VWTAIDEFASLVVPRWRNDGARPPHGVASSCGTLRLLGGAGAKIAGSSRLVFGWPTRASLNLGRKSNLAKIMKYTFETQLIRRLASAGLVTISTCALFAAPCYAQQATPAPSPAVTTAPDGKESKAVQKVAEQPKPPEPRFKLYGWIEAGITGNPDAPVDNH